MEASPLRPYGLEGNRGRKLPLGRSELCHGVEPARLYFPQNDAPLAATVTSYLNVASITR